MTIYENILKFIYSPKFFNLVESYQNTLSLPSFWGRVKRTLGILRNKIIQNDSNVENTINIERKIWFFIDTKNQLDSVEDIYEKMQDAAFLTLTPALFENRYPAYVVNILETKWQLWRLPFLLLGTFFKKPKETFRYFDVFVQSFGYYEAYLPLIEKFQPKAILFSNDHLPRYRAMMAAAQKCGVKTIYVQHSSVTPNFPSLDFDLSLLDGRDSYKKYKLAGEIKGNVELVGIVKFDKYANARNFSTKILNIGIAFNLLDEMGDIQLIITQIKTRFPEINIYFRAHPQDSRNFDSLLVDGVQQSNARVEPVFSFLQKIDLLIAADSGIHLEAIMLNITSFYMSLTKENVFDYYDFVKEGLIPHIKDFESLFRQIELQMNNREQVYLRSSSYNEAIAGSFEGKSAEKCKQLIYQLINQS